MADDCSASVVAANEVIETADDMLDDLDMTPAHEAESDAEIMAALDADDAPADSAVPAPAPQDAEWLADFKALALKHRPFSSDQVVEIVRVLYRANDLAVEAER